MPVWGAVYFQNGVSAVMEQLIFFHDHTMMVLVFVMMVVGYLLVNSLFLKWYNRGIHEGQELESVWTVIPAGLLLVIAFPSLRLLYLMEESDNPELSIKVVGHQWFWSYEYSDLGVESFDSYMLGVDSSFIYRLLEADNSLLLPYLSSIRFVVTSEDVIHSWTIPSLGLKTDAVPGRLNQLSAMFSRPGVFMGQCSEICGANHSFMPVVAGILSRLDFLRGWS